MKRSPKLLYLDVLDTISNIQVKYMVWYMKQFKCHRYEQMLLEDLHAPETDT